MIKDKVVLINSDCYERMISHAQEVQPNECCGILGGRENHVQAIYPLTNDLNAPDRFFGNPKQHFDAIRDIRQHDIEMIGIYHSHPSSPAIPSQHDRQENYYPGFFYFIISLHTFFPDCRCYIMNREGKFNLITIIQKKGSL